MRNSVAAKALIASALMAGAFAAAPAHADEGRATALTLSAAAVQQAGYVATDLRPLTPAGQRAADGAFRLAAAAPRAPDAALLVPRAAGPVAGAPIQLGPAPRPLGPGLMDHAPRLGAFDLTFASDVPASGNDPMFNAEVVVALTHRF